LNASNLDARYNACVKLASSHALIQFGLSIWTRDAEFAKSSRNPNIVAYNVTSYNFDVLSTDTFKGTIKNIVRMSIASFVLFVATPTSLTFLVNNGFDFNALFRSGIPFTPGDASSAVVGDGTGKTTSNKVSNEVSGIV
jgi:hypothetical protein